MRKFNFQILIIVTFLVFIKLNAQSKDTLSVYYYNEGVSAVNKQDYETAKDFFKKSIKGEDNATAEYELAKIFRRDSSHFSWNQSREFIKKAVHLDPNNPKYHLFYGLLSEDLSNISRFEFEANDDAIREFQTTLELDSTNFIAANCLGEMKANEFLKYHDLQFSDKHSPGDPKRLGRIYAKQLWEFEDAPSLSMNNLAEEFFRSSENALLVAIKYDSLNSIPYFTLAKIYEENNEPVKGADILRKLLAYQPYNTDAHVNLGLLYYESSKLDSAELQYKQAIEGMTAKEKEDYLYNSVKVLLEPVLGNKIDKLSREELVAIINKFWEARNPLNLSDYNARLLEHFSRVTYSNLKFSDPKLGIKGWKSDRGAIVLRYGIPPERIRLKLGQGISDKITQIRKITEIWNYPNKSFTFVDELANNNYLYATGTDSQYWDDSQSFAADLRRTQPEEYHPKFEAPIIKVPNASYQFKDFNNAKYTNLFISYGLENKNNTEADKNYACKHTAGIFLFNSYFNKIAEIKSDVNSLNPKNEIEVPDSGNFFINTEKITATPDSGNLAFEIKLDSSKGVASYHGKYILRDFDSNSLQMSDIILGTEVNKDLTTSGRIVRKDYSILPNPVGIFNRNQKLYIYYEVYNLKKDNKGMSDFQQTVLLRRKGQEETSIGKVVGSVLKFIGVQGGQSQVGSTYKYQSNEKDSQIYFQLDMSGYEKGDYILTVELKDNNNGKEINKDVELSWR